LNLTVRLGDQYKTGLPSKCYHYPIERLHNAKNKKEFKNYIQIMTPTSQRQEFREMEVSLSLDFVAFGREIVIRNFWSIVS
jgi:hypothetical protein